MNERYELYDARGCVFSGTAEGLADFLKGLFWAEGEPHVDEFYWVEVHSKSGKLDMGEMTPIQFMGYFEEGEIA